MLKPAVMAETQLADVRVTSPAMTNIAAKLRERPVLADPVPVTFERRELVEADGYARERIEYLGLEGDLVPAFLFTPRGRDTLGGVLVFINTTGSSTSVRAKWPAMWATTFKLSGRHSPEEASLLWPQTQSLSRIDAPQLVAWNRITAIGLRTTTP